MRAAVLGVVAGAAVVCVPAPGPAAASCVAPSLAIAGQEKVRVPVVTPGSALVVTGSAFVDGCDDEGTGGDGGTVGCSSSDAAETETPYDEIRLTLQQDDRRWSLGVADAGTAEDGELGQVTWTVDLPHRLHPGPARLLTHGLARLRLSVR